ncbi:hypothetical protein ACFVUS_08435 [Nocardia sp. NPDC058058]|uniref:hypothetical protein n=1 Tax=Nocardia sp. NPDC058058 TaxID=3346317 RepID=UPI0036DC5DEF
MRKLGTTPRFGGTLRQHAAIAAVIAGLLTGAVGFANADDPAAPPAAPSAEPATPSAEPAAPAATPPTATAPAVEPAPAVPVSPPPPAPATTVPPVTTIPPVPVTTAPPTPPIPLTTVPAVEAPPPAPIVPVPTPDTSTTTPQAPVPVTTLFMLTTMPNAWASTPDIRPALEVQSDGHALRRQDGREINGYIPADALVAATTEVRALALSDMGSPSVSDQGNMIIDFMPKAPDQDVHLIVYAPEFSDGLTDEQKASRKRFADVYQRLLNAFVAS